MTDPLHTEFYDADDYRTALSLVPGLNSKSVAQLVNRCHCEKDFILGDDAFIRDITGAANRAFSRQRRLEYLRDGAKERQWTDDHGVSRIYCLDEVYPQRLSQCDDGPVMLYKLGKCDLDAAHMVAIVGTRHADAYGVEFTRRLVEDLGKNIDDLVIVSGLAYGIDIAAHRASLDNGVRTIAVTANPLNTVYPAEHRGTASQIIRQGGAMITEYATCTTVHRGSFLARNRIIAGICDVTVVVQSGIRGGAMSTARMAAAYDREVLAVPGRVTDQYSEGTNRLVANNTARLITGADDLIDIMGWPARETEGRQRSLFVELSPEAQSIVNLIKEHPELTVNDLCARLGIPYPRMADILFQLEMDNVVTAIPGNRYAYIEM